jgi:hypothetical protein
MRHLKTLIATFALLFLASTVQADSSFSGLLTRVVKIMPSNSSYNSFHGYIIVANTQVFWSGSDGYCSNHTDLGSSDYTNLVTALGNGATVTIYYQNQTNVRCLTGYWIQ